MVEHSVFIVVGSEGTGTHMLRDFLVAAGCSWRQEDESIQPEYDFRGVDHPFVFHRSIPHAGKIDNLGSIIDSSRSFGVQPWLLFIVRDGNAAAQSVERRDPDRNFDRLYFNSYYSLQRQALATVGKVAGNTMGFDLITYEAFCLQEGYRRWLVDRWGLTYPEDFEIKFANDKYYE